MAAPAGARRPCPRWRAASASGARNSGALSGALSDSGPFAAGTVWRETRTMADGGEITEEFRVRECAVPERFVVASPGIGADYRMTYTFVPVIEGRHRGGTMVTVVQDGAPTAPAGRFLAFVFGGLAARTVEGALRRDLDDLAAAA